MGGDAVQSQARFTSPEILGVLAQGLALTSGITVWNSTQVYVRISISPDKFEDVITAAACTIDRRTFRTVSSWIALKLLLFFTLNISETRSKGPKKALRNDPPATLPQFLHISLLQGWQQCDL